MVQVTSQSKKVAKRLKELREKKKITQEELALEAGINRAYVGYIERGERNPSTEVISKLARALKIPVYELFK